MQLSNTAALKITHLNYERGSQKIINDCDWVVEKGGPCALVGESGSGKTTLLLLIARLIYGSQGLIEVCGSDLRSLTEKELAKKVGIVFQDYHLFPHLNVFENLSLAPSLNRADDIENRAHSLLADLNIGNLTERYPFELSGGQKQRVAIARSLMMSPELLLLDEPSAALDVQSSTDLAELLSRLSSRTQILVVSHDLPFIRFFCKRVAKMEAGKVVSWNLER